MADTVKEQLWDPVRQAWVAATPEEWVRQRLLTEMLEAKGFPLALIAVEKALSQLPHVQGDPPLRRADILVFAKGIHAEYSLYPLLLVECKAVPLTEAVVRQVAGYNHYVGAPFVAVAGDNALRTGWYNAEHAEYQWIDFLPHYDELVRSVK